MAKLPRTKNIIQNFVIVIAMLYVFGTSAVGYFAPQLLAGEDGELTGFQKQTLENSYILIVVIISGSIAAIALDKRDSQETDMVEKLLATLDKIDPQIVKKAQEKL